MANVESMIVEDKTQVKQIDREKVCLPYRRGRQCLPGLSPRYFVGFI